MMNLGRLEWGERGGPSPPATAYSAAFFSALARRMAAHTACGVAGIGTSSEPMASVSALMTAGGAAMAPASPQPLMPSGLDGQRVLVMPTVKDGRSWAR